MHSYFRVFYNGVIFSTSRETEVYSSVEKVLIEMKSTLYTKMLQKKQEFSCFSKEIIRAYEKVF